MFFYLLIYIAVFLAAAGQVLLKIGSGAKGIKLLGIIWLNVWVILGLGAMMLSMLFSVRGLSVVPLRDMAFILPTVYVLVPLFSRVFLKERLGRRTILGTGILIAGVVIFNVPVKDLF